MHWPTRGSPLLLLASVSIGPALDFTELSTEHIYALDLDNFSEESATSLDRCLERLPRFSQGDEGSARAPFVRIAHC